MNDGPEKTDTGAITVPQPHDNVLGGPVDPVKLRAVTVRKKVEEAALAPTELAPPANKAVSRDIFSYLGKLFDRAREVKKLIDDLESQRFKGCLPALTLRLDSLYLSACDAKTAHKVLKDFFEDFKAGKITPTFKDVSDGLWFIFKAIRMMPVNPETEQIFQEAIDLCEDMSRRFAPAVFREVKVIVPLLLGIREGLKTQRMSHYDEVIKQASSLDARGNKRIEAERLRIIGSAHLHKVVSSKADKEEEMSPSQKANELMDTARYTQEAIKLLEQLELPPFFEQEGGELSRTKENLARVLLVAAQARQDRSATGARGAIDQAIEFATDTGNILIAVRLLIMRSDIQRFAGFSSIKPTEPDLQMAYDDMAVAYDCLDLLSDDYKITDTLHIDIDLLWETFVHVLMNLTEIEYALGMYREASMHYQGVDGFIANIGDARLKAGVKVLLDKFKAEYADLAIKVAIEVVDDRLYAVADAIAMRIIESFFRGTALQPGEKLVVSLEQDSKNSTQFILRTNIENFPTIAAKYVDIYGRIIRDKLKLPTYKKAKKVKLKLENID